MVAEAHKYLYEKIVSCQYLPGQAINEKELLDETGFGRTPLREALLALQKEGLVEIFPRKGMRIAPYTEESVVELYQARKLMEPNITTEYKTLYSKDKLLDFQTRFQHSDTLTDLERFNLDADFHSYLIAITGNSILINMYQSLMVQQVRLGMYAVTRSSATRSDDLKQHVAIIDALLRENEEDVRDAIIVHINHSMIRSLNAIRDT